MSVKMVWKGDQLAAHVHAQAAQAVKRAALAGEAQVKELTPVDTGRARRSVHTAIEETPHRITATVGGNVAYYIYIELGSRGRPGKAPVGHSVDDMVRQLKNEIKAMGI